MKVSGCLAVIVGIVTAGAPSWAASSGAPGRGSLAPLVLRAPGPTQPGALDAWPDRPLPALAALTGGPTDELLCSLQTLSEPPLLAPAAPALRLLTGPTGAPRYPSLGGPALTLTLPESLPSLRDPAAAPPSPEDTLRLVRSHW